MMPVAWKSGNLCILKFKREGFIGQSSRPVRILNFTWLSIYPKGLCAYSKGGRVSRFEQMITSKAIKANSERERIYTSSYNLL